MATALTLGLCGAGLGAGVGADLSGKLTVPEGVKELKEAVPQTAPAFDLGLAALSAQSSAVFGIFDIPGLINELEKTGLYKKPQDAEIPVKDIVIATGPGLAESLNARKESVKNFSFEDLAFLKDWVQHPQRISHKNLPIPFFLKLAGYLDYDRSEAPTPPLMLSARFERQPADELRQEINGIELEDKLRDWGVTALFNKNYYQTDCKVVQVDGSTLRRKLEAQYVHEEKLGKESADQIRAGLKKLDGATLYVVVYFIEDRMFVTLTPNPEKQVRPATVLNGAMSAPAGAKAATLMKPGMHLFAYVEPATVKAVLKLAAARHEAELDKSRELLAEKCRQWRVPNTSSTLEAYDSFAARTKAWFNKLIADSKDWSLVCWRENGLKIELGAVTDGLFNLNRRPMGNALPPSNSDVIYYHAHLNMDVFAQYRLWLEDFVQGGWNVLEAYALSSRNDLNDQARLAIPLIKINQVAIGQLWSALKDAQDCMTGENTFVLDMKGKPSALVPDMPTPRFAYVCGLKNRDALSQAWDKVVVASRPAAALLSGGKMAQIPPPNTAVDGDTVYYSYDLPYGAELTPVVMVSDNDWGIAMPKEFATEQCGNPGRLTDGGMPLDIRLNLAALRKALAGSKFTPETDKSVKEWVDKTRILKGIRLSGRKSLDNKDYFRLHLIYGKNDKE